MRDDGRTASGGVAGAFLKELKRLVAKKLKVAVSVDLDAIASSFAPGVSAPQADGLTPADLFAIMEACGANPAVVTLGFFELAPPLDRDGATARLCATAIHRFACARARIAGRPIRPSSKLR
jgi:arginase family enzyme